MIRIIYDGKIKTLALRKSFEDRGSFTQLSSLFLAAQALMELQLEAFEAASMMQSWIIIFIFQTDFLVSGV